MADEVTAETGDWKTRSKKVSATGYVTDARAQGSTLTDARKGVPEERESRGGGKV